MNTFPTLRTGAVMQYPASRETAFSTQVLRFVDGSEQRFREYSQPLHRWLVQLDKLDEMEMNALRLFFTAMDGGAQEFSFTDPWDGKQYQTCSFDQAEMRQRFTGPGNCATALVIKE